MLVLQANAKINLSLEIVGKENDGYHAIKSIFQSINLSDFLEIKKNISTQLTGSILTSKNNQVIFKSVVLLQDFVRKTLPCSIHLQKNIPIAAGLGGESVDAAAVIIGINKLYNLSLSKTELREIAIKVGSDVPFFLEGGTRLVEGRGEIVKISSKIKPTNYYVLARPHTRVLTAEIFKIYDKQKNLFESCATVCPDIKCLKKYFSGFCSKQYGLSGSGPTMFCGVDDFTQAEEIAYGLEKFNGDIFIVRPESAGVKII